MFGPVLAIWRSTHRAYVQTPMQPSFDRRSRWTRVRSHGAARLSYRLPLYASRRHWTGLNGVGLSVDDDIFQLEVGDAGGVELVVLDGDVKIFQEDVADLGLAGVGLDGTEGVERALDADDVQVLDDGFRRFHALKIKILRPRRHLDDAAGW